MRELPPALQPLAFYRQFLLWRTAPGPNGKPTKLPCDISGTVVDAHNPTHWTDAATACSMAELQGLGVAFVFTAHDPFFFVDIDHALQPTGQWSPRALELCQQFAGAAIEVSQSGTGLHIIGAYPGTTPPPHRSKNIAEGLELYTEARFVALTGTNAMGNASTSHGPALTDLATRFFPPRTVADGTIDGWTIEPRADWRGPVDDADLLRRAMQSKGASSVFGTKASFADLWERNETVLAAAFPDPTGLRAYDASSADAALAQHLAFWTGSNAERIRDLMRRSGLVREKYEREDYLERTIVGACRMQRDVLADAPPAAAPGPAAPPAAPAQQLVPQQAQGSTFLTPTDQIDYFRGCIYVADAHRVLVPGGHMLKPETFKVRYGGRAFVMDANNEKVSKDPWEAFTQSQVLRPPHADTTCFRPLLEPGVLVQEGDRTMANTWWPAKVERTSGDVSLFLRHLELLLPVERDRRIVLSYCAAVVQYPGVKFQWCPLIQGAEGNGKTLISRCVAAAVGRRYSHWVRADRIHAQFNGWLTGNLFVGVEDIYVPESKREVWEVLKPMITGDQQEVEAKGVDQRTRDVCCNFILNSNHKDAVRKTRNDRRLAIFYSPQQTETQVKACGMTEDYFQQLYGWLKSGGYAMVADFLATYAIEPQFNPAGLCSRAPTTSSTDEAIGVSLGSVEQEILEAIEQQSVGFKGGWISSIQLDALLSRTGNDRRVARSKRRELVQALGYDWHPGLPEGRVDNDVAPDGGRPRLFVKMGTPAAMMTGKVEIAKAYTVAQTMSKVMT